MSDLLHHVRAGLANGGQASSDYDLNPDIVLPAERRLRPAGVLVPILCEGPNARVYLTKRSSALRHHPGQIAFPGGKQDEGDADVTATALREAHEEIGLEQDNVEVLGLMPSHETVTGFHVTPVVARIRGPFQPRPEIGEVDEVFDVPLDHLLNAARFSIQSRRWRGHARRYYTIPFGPYYIWGATARILRTLADASKAV